MTITTASNAAKRYLQSAAHSLGAADPIQLREVSSALEDALPLPVGDTAYRRQPPLVSSFAEERSGHLDFVMNPLGPYASATDRTLAAAKTMEDIVGHHFRGDALRWLKGQLEPVIAHGRVDGHQRCDAGGADDRHDDEQPLVARARGRMSPKRGDAHHSLTPRSGWIVNNYPTPLSLNGLRPLMDAVGLGDKHAGLMSAVAFVLGARFTLPPSSCAITLRPLRGGCELRLDVNLESIPDLPPQLMSLLRLQMAERPQSLRSMDSWLVAMTPEGYENPGTLSILSFSDRPDMPARINLHIRPPVLEQQPGETAHEDLHVMTAIQATRAGRGDGPRNNRARRDHIPLDQLACALIGCPRPNNASWPRTWSTLRSSSWPANPGTASLARPPWRARPSPG